MSKQVMNQLGEQLIITYTGTTGPLYSYTIQELRNRTMVIKYDGTTTINNSTKIISGTMTYEKKL